MRMNTFDKRCFVFNVFKDIKYCGYSQVCQKCFVKGLLHEPYATYKSEVKRYYGAYNSSYSTGEEDHVHMRHPQVERLIVEYNQVVSNSWEVLLQHRKELHFEGLKFYRILCTLRSRFEVGDG